MGDGKGIEVFDGDGPSEVVFIERMVDMLCETYPKFKHAADRRYLELKVRGLVENIEKDVAFLEKREAEESEALEAINVTKARKDHEAEEAGKVSIKCWPCKGTGNNGECDICGGTGSVPGVQNAG